MEKVIIAGGRDFNDVQLMMDYINELMAEGFLPEEFILLHGDAQGADSVAKALCEANGITTVAYPADWNDMSLPCVLKYTRNGHPYNALAGMKRNKEMGDIADKLIAFHDGKSTGTADMIHYMAVLDKPRRVCPY